MPIASFLQQVAIDCPDPRQLAEFYREICGGEIDEGNSDDHWVQLTVLEGTSLGFQRADNYIAPVWPDGGPQQAHLDFFVEDLAAGEAAVLAVGAVKAEVQPTPDRWLVFLDPAGHPFCLVNN